MADSVKQGCVIAIFADDRVDDDAVGVTTRYVQKIKKSMGEQEE